MDELIQHDEDVVQLIALDAADGIGLKISKSGGLTRGLSFAFQGHNT